MIRKAKTGPPPLGLGRAFSIKLLEAQERWLRKEARARRVGLAALFRELVAKAMPRGGR